MVKGGLKRAVQHLSTFFPETIELIIAVVLLSWGIVTLVPVELLPGSVYTYNVAKIPFGILLASPSCYLIILRFRYGMDRYSTLIGRRRQCLFFISVALIYLATLSAIVTLWPPRFLLFFAHAAVAIICYLRLVKR